MKLLSRVGVADGFLSSRWLGKRELGHAFENRSQAKYKLAIGDFGDWRLLHRQLPGAPRPDQERRPERRTALNAAQQGAQVRRRGTSSA